jgi:hypothetical protein
VTIFFFEYPSVISKISLKTMKRNFVSKLPAFPFLLGRNPDGAHGYNIRQKNKYHDQFKRGPKILDASVAVVNGV